MKPPPFDYVAPDTLEGALAVLAEHGDEAQPLAGGQSLVPMLSLRVARPGVVLDLNKIASLSGISVEGDVIRIGAMTRQVDVVRSAEIAAHLPAFIEAMQLVGHFQTRNRGTIGGSLSLGEPAGENPAFAVALDAELTLQSTRGSRTVKASDFYTGPYMTLRRDDELLTSIAYRKPAGARIGIEEVAQRKGDFALTGLVACLTVAGGTVSDARLAWFGMASTPVRARAAEAALNGTSVAGLDLAALAETALTETDPVDDAHATAAYRRDAGRAIFARLLGRLLNEGAAA
jgi:aerobic carbon-monoxide dehydrogenase medium subunit